jgi:bifunctional DNA-binding transcriptional regulator/antitoxin component of YhaV-PrlF toxin-antitoxin module
MPFKTTRKILALGNSGVISIPKHYRNYYGLKVGAEVILLYDGCVLIVPKQFEGKIEEKMALLEELIK